MLTLTITIRMSSGIISKRSLPSYSLSLQMEVLSSKIDENGFGKPSVNVTSFGLQESTQ